MHGTPLARIDAGTGSDHEYLCINEYPDLEESQPDQVEVTTLCDEAHRFIDGLANYEDNELAFPFNYTKTLYAKVLDIIDSQDEDEGDDWGIYFGDETGTDGKFTFKATARVVMNGSSSGEVRTATLYLKRKSAISFA